MKKIELLRAIPIPLIQMTLISVLVFICFSCNNTVMERYLTDDYGESGTDYETGRVLFIVIDGASGTAVKDAQSSGNASHIKAMFPNSMYTFEGLADSKYTLDALSKDRGWANLLTGVTTHGVGLNDGESNPISISSLKTPSFPSLMKQVNPNLRIGLYASDASFHAAFSGDADNKDVGRKDNDGLVRDAVIAELEGTSASDFILAQFSGVELAGRESGFYDESSGDPTEEVIAAIKEVDRSIGQIMDALESRANYEKENWLVVITSTYGGDDEGRSGSTFYDDPDRNTFILMYNARTTSKLLLKPASDELGYKFFTPVYSITQTEQAAVRDATLFNMEPEQSYSIQFMFYDEHGDPWGYQTILSKTAESTYNNRLPEDGWATNFSNNAVSIRGDNVNNNNAKSVTSATGFRRDKKWHAVTFVLDVSDEKVKIYIDGTKDSNEGPFLTTGAINNKEPLRIGQIPGNVDRPTQYTLYITNIQFYDVALPADFIAENYCATHLDEIMGFPYWDHLIGYWPCDREDDFNSPVLKDYSQYGSVYGGANAGKSDMVLMGRLPKWATRSVVEKNICPLPDDSFYKAVFNTVDVSYQVFMWLGIEVDLDWKLEGAGWSLKYSSMESSD